MFAQPSSSPIPIPRPVSMKAVDPLSKLNRVPSTAERTHLLALIKQDQDDASILSQQIEIRRKGKELSEKCVEDIKKSLILSKILQSAVQERIEENLERINNFTEVEKTVIVDTTPEDAEERFTAMNFRTIFGLYKREVERYQTLVESDMIEAKDATSRTHNLEQQLLEARSRLAQESKTFGLLEGCYRQILSSISEKRALISCSRLLADETLISIFQLLLADVIATARENPEIPHSFVALKLSQICQRWRKIVHHTPSLWRYIPIATPRPTGSYSSKVAATSHYLSKYANTQPLIIHWPRNGPWEVGPIVHQNQWGRPYNTTTERVYCKDPLAYCMTHAPENTKEILRTAASVEFIGRNGKSTVECQIPAQRYTIRELQPTFNSAPIAAGVTELRLHIRDMAPSTLNSILAPLVNLSLLELDIPGGCAIEPSSPTRKVTLSKLQHLIISTGIALQVLDVLLNAPSLSQLWVDQSGGDSQSLDNWKLYIDRAGLDKSITRLTLSGSPSEEITKTHILPKFSDWAGVEHLVLRGPHHTPILEALAADRSNLSNLVELSLIETDIPGDILRKFFISRNNQGSSEENGAKRIQRLTLDRCKGIEQGICESVAVNLEKLTVYS
ncbi:hypothetical protein CPB86DRAFT_877236 [Serendipita vermifera]|nr:hypothetical protein CPB86DRAFT_877236 [Serendipita vermifera]